MNTTILGIGTAVPERVLTQADAEQMARGLCCSTPHEVRLLHAIYANSGIEKRHVVLTDRTDSALAAENFYTRLNGVAGDGPGTKARMNRYKEEALTLARQSSLQAIESAHLSPSDVTHLVTVSCSGFSAPGVDLCLIRDLGLSTSVRRLHVGFMGCHGAMNGLGAADAIVRSNPSAVVLLTAVELCSLHFQYGWNPAQLTANALFSDGAASLICAARRDDGIDCAIAATGSHLFPGTESAMTWQIGDHGFEMYLAATVPGLIRENLRPWLTKWLEPHRLAIEDVPSWAIHPGGPRILRGVQQALSLSEDQMSPSFEVFRNHGNMSSPTVLFILKLLREQRAALPCVMLGFGPGLAAEAALVVDRLPMTDLIR